MENYFTFGGKDNNKNKVYYKDLPKETRVKLDETIKERSVHLKSTFGVAALKGGFDPEKVSYNQLVAVGWLRD